MRQRTGAQEIGRSGITTGKRGRGTTGGAGGVLVALLVALLASLALSANALASNGVQCAQTGMETVATDRDGYQPGETVHITGDGYSATCDLQVDVERPDGVVESFAATTDLGGGFSLDYLLPPFPGVSGDYTVRVRGLNGAELASTVFADAPAPQFDIAPAHVATTGTRVFTALVRNTANGSSDTARCIRVTTPGSVTVTSATFVVANPGIGAGQTGNWSLTTGANFVQLRTDTNTSRGIFGTTGDNWVRFEITANATSAGTAEWETRMTTTWPTSGANTGNCVSSGSTDKLGVSVAEVLPRQYTADFRDVTNTLIATPAVVEDTSQAYRIRVTRTAGSDDLQHILVALPTCFTNITGVSTSDSGPPDYTAALTDNTFRLIPNTKLAANGQWVQVHFTATADCPTGAHEFRTASWKNTSPETSQGDIYQLSPGTLHPTLTVLSANVAPVANNDAYSTNEDTTLNVAAPGVLGNDVDTNSITVAEPRPISAPSNGTLTLNSDGSFEYVPNANFFGTDTFTYKATDGSLSSNEATVTITVNAVNDVPVANDDSYTLGEDSILAVPGPVGVLANDTDADGDTLTAVLDDDVDHGSLALATDGTFAYSPNNNFCGTDTFTYHANDGTANSNIATVTLTVTCVNDDPNAVNDAATVAEDSSANAIDVLANDTNPDAGETLTVTAVTQGTNGSVTFTATGVSYTPNADFFGSDSFTYTISDGNGKTDTATVNVTVTNVNDDPNANDDSATVAEDSGANAIDVLANDNDGPDSGETLTVTAVTQGTNGSVTFTATGVSYTPNANFFGSDSFTYTISDGNGGSDTATVSVTVNAVNDAPSFTAGGDVTVDEDSGGHSAAWASDISAGPANESDQTVEFDVGNDNNALFSSQPAIAADGTLTFTPAADANGSAEVTVSLSDSGGTANGGDDTSDEVTFTITVSSVNDAPSFTAGGDVTVNEDSGGYSTAWASDVSAGPANESDQTVEFDVGNDNNALFSSQPAIAADGTLTFTPAADANGSAEVTVSLSDSGGTANGGDDTSDEVTFTITVSSVNDAPVNFVPGPQSVPEDGTLTFSGLNGLSTSDVDAGTNDVQATVAVTEGTFTLGATVGLTFLAGDGSADELMTFEGTVDEINDALAGSSYAPDANYYGPASLSLTVNDNGHSGSGGPLTDSDSVAIEVTPVNDAPVADDDAYSVAEDNTLLVPAPGVLSNDTDVDSAVLTAVLVDGPSDGTLTLNADGSFSYAPDANFNGTDSFTYKANDGELDSNVAEVTITVNPVNDAPVANDDSHATDEDTDLNVAAPGVLGNDSDVDGDSLTAVLVTDVSNGTLTLNADGSFSYTPDANWFGTDSFTYKANDGELNSNVATVTITVRSVNDAPVVSAGNDVSGAEGSPIVLDGTVSDVEDSSLTTQWTYAAGPGVDAGATCSFANASSVDTTITCTDDGSYTATLTATDDDGASTSDSTTVTVSNVPPTLTSLTPSSYLVLKGTAVTVTGEYSDPSTNDTFTCVVNWDEPTGTPEPVGGSSTTCTASHTYTAQGTYTVSMKVLDDDSGESNTLLTIITVYDPGAGGFVTGGGWITSPPGSYAAAPTASGRANFGFTSQYKKGASTPTGETEFQLHFASFNFHSTAYEVLVVSGYKAQFRGTGTVNGESGYKFVLTAYDGQLQGDGVDKFRIKISRISDGVTVYDTKMGVSEDMDLAAPLAIGGGSIVIHKGK